MKSWGVLPSDNTVWWVSLWIAMTAFFAGDGHEIVSHGYRWLDYQTMPEETEREHVRLGIETLERVAQNLGFSTGEDFARYMIDCFEVMYQEGAEHPKLMSLALHDRLTGRPGQITGLVKFLDHITARARVDLHRPRNRRTLAAHSSGLLSPP